MGMLVRSILLLATAFALAGCAAAPQTGEVAAATPAQEPSGLTAATAEQTTTNAGPDEVVCSLEQQTGSRFKKKVCRTRAEIDEMSRSARETMRTRDRSSGNSNAMKLPGGG